MKDVERRGFVYRVRYSAKLWKWYVKLWISEPVLSHVRGWRYRDMPTAMITGSVGKTTTTRMLAAILTEAGHITGRADTGGVWVGEKKVFDREASGWPGHRVVFKNARVTAASLETARGGVKKLGFYIRNVTTAAMLNIGYEHVGTDGLNTLEDIARLKRRVTDAARSQVLNADNAHTLALAQRYKPENTVLFSLSDSNPNVDKHIMRGGRAIVLTARNTIQLLEKGKQRDLLKVEDVPTAHGGKVTHMVANAMAAAALAILMGIEDRAITQGLSGFQGGERSNPGSFTVIDRYDFQLMVTKGVNPASLASDVPAFKAVNDGAKKHHIVFAGVGNRTDEQYRKAAAELAGQFDTYILRDTPYWLRQRRTGHVPQLVRQALLDNGVPDDLIHIVAGDEEAFALAEKIANPGDAIFVGAKIFESGPIMEAAFASRKVN